MADHKFKNGDPVRLKSGGPKMTVVKYDDMGLGVYCRWFVGQESKGDFFPEDSLELAGDDPDPVIVSVGTHEAK